MVDVAIIGAGLTGLSAAYHLEKLGITNYIILEKDATIGGLCRSLQQDGFTFDYTGHLLHINDPYFRNFIETLVGLESFNSIERQSFIYSQNCFTKYPYQSNLYGLPFQTIIDCIKGFIERKKRTRTKNFHQWVLTHFGEGFGKHFFFPYQEKIFDFPVQKLSASWTGRFVPATSLEQIIQGSLTDRLEEKIGYNAHFFYPQRGGIFFWVEKIAQALKKPIITSCPVSSIDLVRRTLTCSNGESIAYKHLITTMPLDCLLQSLKEPASVTLAAQQKRLKCNSVINFNIGVSSDLGKRHWVYYPEPSIPFYRIGFPHNFSRYMAPVGCSSLYGELSSFRRNEQENQKRLLEAYRLLTSLWNIQERDIVTQKVIHIPHAYVLFDQWRDKYLPCLLQKLEEYNVYSVGRYGAWKYSSMQEGVLDGKNIAERLRDLL